ncbi:MAG: DUF1275 domain-containing protein [Tissierellia bacterium]|nr:DUF1275 domain-containing protein [Tissierellia bacterium]
MARESREGLLSLWILLLSFGSGYVNMSAVLKFGQPVSHATGNITSLAQGIFDGQAFLVGRLLSVMVSFVLGATFAGMLFSKRSHDPRKRFGFIPLFGGIGAYLLRDYQGLLYYLSFLMGLQNAMFLDYRGHLVRSTHFTGYMTDIGFELGSYIMGRRHQSWKIVFYFLSILLFIIGGIMSAIFDGLGMQMEVLALLYIFLGVYYIVFRWQHLFPEESDEE